MHSRTLLDRSLHMVRKVRLSINSLFDTDPVLASVNRHLARKLLLNTQFFRFEGHIGWRHAKVLRNTVAKPGIKRVVEIGFNAGHSAAVLLQANPNIRLLSFDIGEHQYVDTAAKYISQKFPGRHELILGKSQKTVPEYAAKHKNKRFDLVFIDGGHTEKEAWADLLNCRDICKKGGIVVVDDVAPGIAHGIGPAKAWERAKAEGLVQEIELTVWPDRNGKPRRGMAIGGYR